jgi:hypothetical protein
MTITDITEILNPHNSKVKPIKEKMKVFIPNIINKNIPNRNGFIWLINGSGGRGKSSMVLSLFRDKNMYRNIFNNIYLFVPISSFSSVVNNPFKNHENVYHELNVDILEDIFNELTAIKVEATKKKEKKKKVYVDEETDDDDIEKKQEIEYSLIIIDDFADQLKQKAIFNQLNKMCLKARHLCCSFIFLTQNYYYFPKRIRCQITNGTFFEPNNEEEYEAIRKEVIKFNEDDARKIYDYVFDANYNHLDIDLFENKYYKNFNLLNIKK